MTREQELIAEYEAAMNAPLSERDKELMISVLKWADNHPSDKVIAKYLYENKGYAIDLNGDIPSFEETMKDVERYINYKIGKLWHKVDKELPPPINAGEYFSDSVIVTDGVLLCQGYYNYIYESWEVEGDIDSDEVTHWMYLPELPK